MSGPLAIAGVTAVLKDVLNNGLIDHDLAPVGSFSVTAVPPDRITTGTQEPNQLNLFLYQVTPNQGWRNVGLPSRDSSGERLSNPPLALDLHYLLTAYGAQDFNAEILLGYALQILHEHPVLSRRDIRTALSSPIGSGLPSEIFGNLSALDLAEQVEQIKITPHYLTTEELSKLWTAMQARYRQSMAYQVSVVLIQSTKPAKTALPVLSRGEDDRGVDAAANVVSLFPLLENIHIGPVQDGGIEPLPTSYPSAELGLQLILQGQNLTGDSVSVEFKHTRYSEPEHPLFLPPLSIPVLAADRTASRIKLTLPTDPAAQTAWRTGLYNVAVSVTQGTKVHHSNDKLLVLAPRINAISPANPIARVGVKATVTLTCSPQVLKEQTATLLLPDREVIANAHPANTDTLVFVISDAPVATDLPVRLCIDGVDSMPFTRTYDGDGKPLPPVFADNQQVTIV
ncbi:MAG: DUF4255 domain-containing protein [Methylococcaceae bacterium]|nr:DUF4255 domain-containing protein [Methylococcaceae bacterium]MDP2392052.1 DUF4255 domain-containing protein [Methylococcaceae bacterium]MDP3020956.1 DUF4255 domain-containing protein [Methylococcaceae bacterium]MDP3391169.1 DUF4255 domain-containing protein [Methylococcaceae bacterium]MDP3931712.1 DUF4255 domain-containing protein [Methylococcaceae bacterium]